MATPAGKTKLIIDIPEDLKTEFKLYCIRNKTNMTEVLTDFIQKTIEERKKAQ
jgi:Ni2+-binding GTPase involved in maturation of urease and hydrogenase